MHDGALETLDDVVAFYDRGCGEAANKSSLVFPLGLSDDEKGDLVAFLTSLTGTQPESAAPSLPSGESAEADPGRREAAGQ